MYESRNTGAMVVNYVLIAARLTAPATEQEMTMSGRRTLIAISAALALGIAGASVARAGDSGENHQDLDRADRSVVRINHPVLFGNSLSAGAYGYVAEPTRKHRAAHARIENR
jgi:hypothetical protein